MKNINWPALLIALLLAGLIVFPAFFFGYRGVANDENASSLLSHFTA